MKWFILSIVLLFSSPAAMAELNPLLQSSANYKKVLVAKVLTPDTIELESGERVQLLGLLGPRAPKVQYEERDEHGFIIPKDVDPATSAEEDAFKLVRTLLEGKKVRLEFDSQRRNEDNVLQAYVFFMDGSLVNAEILRQGAANLRITPPNVKYADQLRSAYQEARREMRGMQGQW
jgi:micrococcal nuclease